MGSGLLPERLSLLAADAPDPPAGAHHAIIDGVELAPSAAGDCETLQTPRGGVERCRSLAVPVSAAALSAGVHQVRVRNPDPVHCESSEPAPLHVLPPPVLAGVTPQPLCVAQGERQVAVAGEGFLVLDGAVPSIRMGGVEATSVTASGCQQVEDAVAQPPLSYQLCTTLTGTVPEAALEAGAHAVVVHNPASAQCRSEQEITLTVVAPPTVTGVAPAPVCMAQGERSVQVSGTGFLFVGATPPAVSFGAAAATGVQNVYGAGGPRLYLLRTRVQGSSAGAEFGENTQTATELGLALALGGELALGPGRLLAELDLGAGPLRGLITGDAAASALGLVVGYRLLF
jgi:hypothetical protein